MVPVFIGGSFRKSSYRVCEDDLDKKGSYLFKKAVLNGASVQ